MEEEGSTLTLHFYFGLLFELNFHFCNTFFGVYFN